MRFACFVYILCSVLKLFSLILFLLHFVQISASSDLAHRSQRLAWIHAMHKPWAWIWKFNRNKQMKDLNREKNLRNPWQAAELARVWAETWNSNTASAKYDMLGTVDLETWHISHITQADSTDCSILTKQPNMCRSLRFKNSIYVQLQRFKSSNIKWTRDTNKQHEKWYINAHVFLSFSTLQGRERLGN